ncbi:MAG TPA: amino acid adenylation domain-containing protein [Pyrinomonadaceae bacterium]
MASIGSSEQQSEGEAERRGFAERKVALSAEVTKMLRQSAASERVTLHTLVEGAWAEMLMRYSSEEEVVFGTTVAGRPAELSGVEQMVGLFINTLPVRVKKGGEKRGEAVGEWLRRLQREQAEMREYEHVALVEVQRWSEVGGGRQLFDYLLVFENFPVDAMLREQPGSLKITEVRSMDRTSYPLTLVVGPRGENLLLEAVYDESRFEGEAVEQMLGHMSRLLESMAAQVEQPVGRLSMLDEQERVQLLAQPEDEAFESSAQTTCLHELFEAQAARTPDAVALVAQERRLSCAELNRRANRLAHYLREQGVGREVPVGLLLERSAEMIVSLLAVLKAGGFYVPLDPSLPSERLSFMLADVGMPILITHETLAERVPQTSARLLFVNEEGLTAEQPDTNPAASAMPENLAYVIYTSGSTGRPKGVAVTHANVSRLLSSTQHWFNFNEQDVWTLFHSYAFDFSVWEIWGALAYGGKLVVVPYLVSREPEEFYRLLVAEGVTVLNQTPSAFRQLIRAEESLGAAGELKLRYVIFGGEALELQSLRGWVERHGEVRPQLVNMYGITETTVHVTYRPLGSEDIRSASGSLIGRAIPDLRLYVLDAQMEPVPLGVHGELYVGGSGLARGYLGRAETTAERFVPDPFGQEPGARLYRTGDLVRRVGAAELEYVGRIDQQVKVRGFRIELGEIEAVLAGHEDVREAVVVARDAGGVGGEKRLVAYVVLHKGGQEDGAQESGSRVSGLKRYARERLPDYMVPSVVMELERLPLTGNGKLDRRALPEVELERGEQVASEYAMPRTEAERVLAEIWGEVLGIKQVGIEDNFFELGGDSILSLQIVSRANRAGLRLTPKLMFTHQTISQLATVIDNAPAVESQQSAVSGEVPLTPIQHWFFEREMPERHHFNQSLLLEVPADVHLASMERAVERLLAHHDALRLRFRQTEKGWQQFNEPSETQIVFSHHDLSGVAETEHETEIEAVATRLQKSFDLASGPLVRVAHFSLGEAQAGRLLLIVHHLAVDGVSWRIILEDLQSAYEQLREGKEPALAPKTTSFKRWAEALTEHAKSDAVRQESGYWQKVVGGEVRRLPVDSAGGTNEVAKARTVTVRLAEGETRALLKEVPEVYRTQINEALLSALARTFARWAGDGRFLVNLEGHGREEISPEIDTTRTVGWFTSMFPVALEASAQESPGAALKRIKEELRRIPQRGIGYGLLRYLDGDAQAGESPLSLKGGAVAEASFNYLGQFDQMFGGQSLFNPVRQSTGASISERGQRAHLLEIDAMVVGGELNVNFTYGSELHSEKTVEALAQGYVESLRQLIAQCRMGEESGYTPSDFPLAALTQNELDVIAATRGRIENVYPLSHTQLGILFHSLYAPQQGTYHILLSYEVLGKLNVGALKRAWQKVLERHAVLRTGFVWEVAEEPVQVVEQHVELPFEEHDWRALSGEEQQERLQAYLEADRLSGFDLRRPPLMRLSLLRLGDERHFFTWSHHHILLDGWCVPLILKDVFTLYETESRGESVQLERGRPYSDYIAWLGRQDLKKAETFWRETLAGFSAPTPLPADNPPAVSPSESREYGEHEIRLSARLTDDLKTVARQHRLTLNSIVQGAWALLLSRYSGEPDVVFGITVSGRPADLNGVETMVGLFINTLPLRVRIDGDEAISKLLSQVHEQQVEIQQYEYSPLVEVQGWSELAKGTSLFESILVFENYPVDAELRRQSSTSLEVRDVRTHELTNYPLTLVVSPGENILVRMSFQKQRFQQETIARMLGTLETLLEGIADDAAQVVSELPLLDETERRQILVGWNDTERLYPEGSLLHQQFEQQAEATPDAVALVYEDERLTYAELDRRANQLSHYLRRQGVGADVAVGLMLERSIEMVVGLFGVLKAGGYYVPLDPAYPQDRLSFMLEDSALDLLLTQERLLERVPASGIKTICLDRDWAEIASESTESPAVELSDENNAYMIYTSGSTGKPKGAMNTHRAICNRLFWMQEAYQLDDSDRILQKTPFSFDVSVWEFFWPLMTGARLVMARPGGHQDSAYLARIIEQEGITTLHFVPSMLSVFLEERDLRSACASLRRVICSGEALPYELQERFFERLDSELHNLYGPTEAAVDVTFWECRRASERRIVPIGRPISNIQMYVLDEQMQPVPVGVAGELHIGGVGLARGYYRRPALTAERFIPDPFSLEGGQRLYKTGDLARHLPDGEIEYLGRLDHQVKIRGLRIELGEIEAVLGSHESVREVVVLAREDAPGDKRLVAYIVNTEGVAEPTNAELRAYLLEKLPDYMIPSAFVRLDQMPLTPNGKVNRRALPAPARPHVSAEREYNAPTSEVERKLATVWQEVLHVERVSVEDNFFELGGDSIRSIQIRTKAQKLGLEVSIQQIFQHQNIRELARALADEEPGVDLPEKIKTAPFSLVSEEDRAKLPDGLEDAYPLAQLQAGMLFHSEFNPSDSLYHNVSSAHLKAPFDADKFEAALRQLLARHPVLRTSFDLSTYSEPLQLVHREVPTLLSFEDLRQLEAEEQERIIAETVEAEKQQKFDWTQAPLIRFRVQRRTDETFQVTLAEHHAILDGWSVATMLTELFHLYFASDAEAGAEEQPPVTFRDFVALERAALASEEIREFWREKLSDFTATRLPRREAAKPEAATPRASWQATLSAELVESLKGVAQGAGVPLKSVLLAAHMRVLSLMSGQTDVTTGVVTNGRPEEAGGEKVLGLFLNTLPLRLKLTGGTWSELVSRTFDAERELLPNRRYPLAALQRMHGNQPLYEMALNFVHFHVYQSLESISELESLGGVSFAETNFPIDADFILGLDSSQIQVNLSYDTREFDAQQIEEIGNSYLRVLSAMADDPQRRYEETLLLTAEEEHKLLAEWSETAKPAQPEKCLHELFEERVKLAPDRVAVRFGDEQLTYAELNARANQLAHYLRSRGVGAETPVGLLLERSLEMIVALIGVLKAGGAYVPLDRKSPRERLSLMLEGVEMPVLLTQEHLAELLPQMSAEVFRLDADWKATLSRESAENPALNVEPENLAYVIYTSGSTGRPKGTMIRHAGLVNFVGEIISYYEVTEADRVLQFSPISFDTSAEEIYSALLSGATLVLRTEEMLSSASTFLQKCDEWGVTVLDLPTAYWHELTRAMRTEISALPESIRLVIVGGERALPRLLAEWRGRVGDRVRLSNGYGPTEATVVATLADIAGPKASSVASQEVSIGRAIGGAQTYILDRHMQPVPVGVAGELHVGGVGLARGYLGRPGATAERFIPHPFSAEPGARLYKTGDLVRYLPNGEIEYLGRIDQQVKLRGFRIELGEIEATLNRHPGVGASAVILREDEPGEKRLVAYVVAAKGAGEGEASSSAWRNYLKEKLPSYMVPQSFVLLEALPLTLTGKIDLRALPAPEQQADLETSYAPPRSEVESRLVEIWQEVMQVGRIGIHDNFFDLGGHSLLAMQVVSRVRDVLEVEITLRTLFESPTVETLAVVVEERRAAPAQASAASAVAAAGGAPAQTIERIDRSRVDASLLAELEGLSDEEVDRLLPTLLGEMETENEPQL